MVDSKCSCLVANQHNPLLHGYQRLSLFEFIHLESGVSGCLLAVF